MVSGLPWGFVACFVVAIVIFVAIFTLGLSAALRSRRVLREAGLSPMTARAQLLAGMARGPLMRPTKTLEEKLSALEDLHRCGLITDSERSSARARLLVED